MSVTLLTNRRGKLVFILAEDGEGEGDGDGENGPVNRHRGRIVRPAQERRDETCSTPEAAEMAEMAKRVRVYLANCTGVSRKARSSLGQR